jgi:hypothetical protein
MVRLCCLGQLWEIHEAEAKSKTKAADQAIGVPGRRKKKSKRMQTSTLKALSHAPIRSSDPRGISRRIC